MLIFRKSKIYIFLGNPHIYNVGAINLEFRDWKPFLGKAYKSSCSLLILNSIFLTESVTFIPYMYMCICLFPSPLSLSR